MELFFMSLTTGIMVGGIYALVALGWVAQGFSTWPWAS